MKRFDYDQRQNWRRAVRLNADNIRHDPRPFGFLRSLYRSIRGGQQYGLYSGYQP